MKKIDLKNYLIKARNEAGEIVDVPYDVKTSITNLMFNPELKLSARELVLQDTLSRKIEDADEFVLLEEAEYAKVKRAFDVFIGFDRNSVELIGRIENAETVEVKVK